MIKNIIIVGLILCVVVLLILVSRRKAEKGQRFGHPFPMTGVISEVCDPVTKEPKIRVYYEQWTDGKWKLFDIFFKESNAIWRIMTVTPYDPGQWVVDRFESVDANDVMHLSFSRREDIDYRLAPSFWNDMNPKQ